MLGAVLLVAGCEGPQSTLAPAGPSALHIALVWWGMLIVATVVFLGVVALWLVAMQRRSGDRDTTPKGTEGRGWIIGGGIVLPATAITALVVFGSPAGLHQLPLAVRGGPPPMVVEVTGHQWWWEVHYPGTGLRQRNTLHLPVGRPVDVHVQTGDVVHSFWVPRLGGKLDAIPGRRQVVRLQADQAGTFRGQCAEFCGLEHARMVMQVQALPAAEFEAWLQQARTRVAAP